MAALTNLPDDVTEIGAISISLFMGADGLDHGYGIEGLSKEAALGYLSTVTDHIRASCAAEWEDEEFGICVGPECPACGFTPNEEDSDHE